MCTTTDNREQVEATARQVLGEQIVALIEQYRQESNPESQLIAVLHRVQAEHGYLAEAHLDAVAQLMRVPAAKVAGVASFYHYYRLQPRGRFMISVCLGTACYVKGADRVAQKLMEELGVQFGETTTDGVFTLESSRCIGTCPARGCSRDSRICATTPPSAPCSTGTRRSTTPGWCSPSCERPRPTGRWPRPAPRSSPP